ncbi:aminotransferase class I/II-fold pyridoxal phosphate-dependent enzyme, partial [bacterium]
QSSLLVEAIKHRYEVKSGEILCGNGSAELIDLTLRALAPSRVILCPPDFGLYSRSIPASVETLNIPRKEAEGFAVDTGAILKNLKKGDLVLFSNPGNPSGSALPEEEVMLIARAAREAGATLVVDEAFADFCPSFSVLDYAGEERALVVLRSLTKFYAIPGIRTGFLKADGALVDKIASLQLPWSVGVPAQVVGAACLKDDNWAKRSRDYLGRSKEKLLAGLASIPGFTALPSEANYILIRLDAPAPSADELYARLRRSGTLIRHCGSFGLGDRYVRIAVRTVGENADLVRHLQKMFGLLSGSA